MCTKTYTGITLRHKLWQVNKKCPTRNWHLLTPQTAFLLGPTAILKKVCFKDMTSGKCMEAVCYQSDMRLFEGHLPLNSWGAISYSAFYKCNTLFNIWAVVLVFLLPSDFLHLFLFLFTDGTFTAWNSRHGCYIPYCMLLASLLYLCNDWNVLFSMILGDLIICKSSLFVLFIMSPWTVAACLFCKAFFFKTLWLSLTWPLNFQSVHEILCSSAVLFACKQRNHTDDFVLQISYPWGSQ